MKAGSKSVFAREATGLVRGLTKYDAMLCGIQDINYGVGALMSFTWSPFLYPGAIIWLAFALGAIPLIFHAISWGMMASAMPRSGADYVWVSRILKTGSVGFAITFVFMFFLQLATGGVTAMISYYGFSQLFWQWGHSVSSPQLIEFSSLFSLAHPWTIFLVGSIIHVILLLNCILPLRRTMQALWGIFIVGNIGWILMIVLLLTHSHAQFAAEFSEYAPYEGIMNAAKELGFSYSPSLVATLGALPLAFINMTGYTLTNYVGGEVKRAQKSLITATVGALVISLVAYVSLYFALEQTVGMDFIASLGYLWFGAPDKYPNIPPPIPYFLASILTRDPWISGIISLSNILWMYGLVMVGIFLYSRTMFAWAFDRVMPVKLAQVSERWHSPTYAVLIQVVLLEAGLAIATVAPVPLQMNFVLAFLLSTACVTSFTITLFPWLNKDIFERAPEIVKRPVLGIPAVSVCGGISFVWLLYLTYLTLTNPALGGTFGLTTILAVFVFAFLWYFGAKWYRKKQGIDLGMAFQQIPPE